MRVGGGGGTLLGFDLTLIPPSWLSLCLDFPCSLSTPLPCFIIYLPGMTHIIPFFFGVFFSARQAARILSHLVYVSVFQVK